MQTYSSSPSMNSKAANNDPFAEDEWSSDGSSPKDSPTFKETGLHRAIRNKNEADIRAILDHKGKVQD